MTTHWWENFFHGVALDFWRAAVSEEQTRAEADFIQKQLRLSPAAKVLDVPCGNGRLSLELATRGFDLTGLDIASEFIEEAKSNSVKRDLKVHWHNREMRDLPWSKTFDGAFCFGNSFGFLEDQDNAEFLEAVSHALKPGARFIIDSGAIAECILPAFQEHRSFELGGITLVIDSRYDHEEGRLFTDYTFIRDGQADKRPGSQRIYTYHELAELLRAAGFAVVDAYSSVAEDPFKLGSHRLLIVAAKG
ncbi:MAG: class I SAM-dependent methyltransferase [bacterium]